EQPLAQNESLIHFERLVMLPLCVSLAKRQANKAWARGRQFLLKLLREFPGAKTERKRFLLSQGKLCFAKITSSGGRLTCQWQVNPTQSVGCRRLKSEI
ncbi:MAG: hypothetical protein II697_01880, partial [Clostridia bacterium]|nr:hypothetical protein [Clostridia bacterium]